MAAVAHYLTTPLGQLRVWEAGDGPLVLVLPGLIRAASVVATELARRAPGLCFRAIEPPGIGGSSGVRVADAVPAIGAALRMMQAEAAPVIAFDLARSLAGTLDAPVILVDADADWPAPASLAPQPDGRHLTALFAHIRDAHLLDRTRRRAAREGAALPDADALDAIVVAAGERPEVFAKLWANCLAGAPPAGAIRAADLADALDRARTLASAEARRFPPTAPADTIWRDYADTRRGRIHLRRAGRVGRPLIALPSAPGSAAPLAPVIAGLACGRQVVAVDYLGNGGSDKPDGDVDMALLGADVLALAEALGFAEFDLWGTHTGALIALEAAIAAPERVGRLVLEAPPLLSPEFNADILANYFPPLLPDCWGLHLQQAWNMRRDMFLFWPWYRRAREAARPLDLPDAEFLHDWTIGLLQSGRTYHRSYSAAFEYDTRARLPRLRRPALVCAGPSDMLADGLDLARRLAPDWITVEKTAATAWYPHQAAPAVAGTIAAYARFLAGQQQSRERALAT